ncbi:MAG: Ldh family oxidoreductase, partial [Campylobacter sp.]|nr:Ldh family oxidoreductase [Campylobacter sp.]
HYGIAGYYANMAIKEDLMGISMTNSASNMDPTYGKRPMPLFFLLNLCKILIFKIWHCIKI